MTYEAPTPHQPTQRYGEHQEPVCCIISRHGVRSPVPGDRCRRPLLVAGGVLLLLLADAGHPRHEPSGIFSFAAGKPLSDGTLACSVSHVGWAPATPGVHFYRTAPAPAISRSGLPRAPAAPTPMSRCRLEATIGYVLPPSRPTIGAIGLFFYPLRRGDNFYAVAASRSDADRIARFVRSHPTLIGY